MIERVIDKRTKNGTVEYLVQWVGKKEGDDDRQLCQRIADIKNQESRIKYPERVPRLS